MPCCKIANSTAITSLEVIIPIRSLAFARIRRRLVPLAYTIHDTKVDGAAYPRTPFVFQLLIKIKSNSTPKLQKAFQKDWARNACFRVIQYLSGCGGTEANTGETLNFEKDYPIDVHGSVVYWESSSIARHGRWGGGAGRVCCQLVSATPQRSPPVTHPSRDI